MSGMGVKELFATLTVVTIKLDFAEPRGKKAVYCFAERGSIEKHCNLKGELMTTIEHRQVYHHPTNHATLAKTKEEPACQKTSIAFHGAHASIYDTPGDG